MRRPILFPTVTTNSCKNHLQLDGLLLSDQSTWSDRETAVVDDAMLHGDVYDATIEEFFGDGFEIKTDLCGGDDKISMRFPDCIDRKKALYLFSEAISGLI